MKNAKIFLVDDKVGNLTAMVETGYVTEAVLQAFLAKYPDLLAGDQIDQDNPRRWLLVAREMGVPGGEAESDRWSLDHLFLDQDGMPTFVECKRSVDTRARREVVAQMLDYAANGIEYWSMDRLRQAAAETAAQRKHNLDDDIRQLLDTDQDAEVDSFWKAVEANLRTGKVRLIFVADEIPRELRRLVEFLNEKMTDVEVLAVEVKQFAGEGQTALVPRVIGATETARALKQTTARPHQKTTAEAFLASCAPAVAPIFQYVLDQAQARNHVVYWGGKGFSVRVQLPDRLATFVYGYPPTAKWPTERLEFYFGYLPLSDDQAAQLRQALLAHGVFVEGGENTLRAFLEGDTRHSIKAVYDFILGKIDEIMAQLSAQ